jgi:hypothetical protein
MAYTSNIPQATDRPNNSQSQILANFTAINTVNSVNHVVFNDADQGKHKFVTMPEQAADPTTAVNEVAIFSQESALTSVAELAIRKENNGDVVEFTSAGKADPGWAILPSGILIKWGSGTASGVAQDVNYNSAVPFGAVYSVTVTPRHSGGTNDRHIVVYSSSLAKFQVTCTLLTNLSTAATTAFYYFAVGIPA